MGRVTRAAYDPPDVSLSSEEVHEDGAHRRQFVLERMPVAWPICPVCRRLLDYGPGTKTDWHHWDYDEQRVIAICADCHRDVVHEYGRVREMAYLANSVDGLDCWIDVALLSIQRFRDDPINLYDFALPDWYEPSTAVRAAIPVVPVGQRGLADFV